MSPSRPPIRRPSCLHCLLIKPLYRLAARDSKSNVRACRLYAFSCVYPKWDGGFVGPETDGEALEIFLLGVVEGRQGGEIPIHDFGEARRWDSYADVV